MNDETTGTVTAPLDLNTGRQLSEAGTPGPWWVERGGDGHADPDEFYAVNPGSRWRGLTQPLNCDSDQATADLIAWLGTHRDALIAAAEQANGAESTTFDAIAVSHDLQQRAEKAEAERDAAVQERDRFRSLITAFVAANDAVQAGSVSAILDGRAVLADMRAEVAGRPE